MSVLLLLIGIIVVLNIFVWHIGSISSNAVHTSAFYDVQSSGGPLSMYTKSTYNGDLMITVSGTVRDASTGITSDAFYGYEDSQGKAITPPEDYESALWLDNQPMSIVLSPIPPYNPSHEYTFSYHANGNAIGLGVDPRFKEDVKDYLTVEIKS